MTSRRTIAVAVLLGSAVLFAYWKVLLTLVHQWRTDDVYSYGFLVPAISAFLVWQRRDELKTTPRASSPFLGLAILLAGVGLLLTGRRVGLVGVQEVSLVPVLMGLVLIVAGPAVLRVVWFPIVYLLAMMPIWDIITDPLHYPFQRFTAWVGGSMLASAGVPVFRQGIFLHLPDVTIEVARLCSGVNYLIAVIAIGVPLAYTELSSWLRRTALVAFALSVAILANPVRVALIGLSWHYRVSQDVHGPGHVLQGVLVAIAGYLALFVGIRVLARNGETRSQRGVERASMSLPVAHAGSRRSFVAAGVAAALLALGGALPPSFAYGDLGSAAVPVLPARIGDWSDVGLASSPEGAVPVREAAGTYRAPSGQTAEIRLIPFDNGSSPLPDLGGEPMAVDLDDGQHVNVNRAIHATNLDLKVVLYWYAVDGKTFGGARPARVFSIWRALTGPRPQPVLVVVSGPTGSGSEGDVTRELVSLARNLVTSVLTPSS